MSQVTLNIAGNNYTIACDDGQEKSLLDIADIINKKAQELCSGGRLEEKLLLAMLNIIFVDELLKTKEKLDIAIKEQKKPNLTEMQIKEAASLIDNLTNKISDIASSIKL
jgi:cell division protein ZapA